MRMLDPNSSEVGVGIKLLNGAKVRFPEQPVDIELFFGYHGQPEHLDPKMKPAIQGADLYVDEILDWTPESERMRQAVAYGDENALVEYEGVVVNAGEDQRQFFLSLNEVLFDTNVTIQNADTPKGHSLSVRHAKAIQQAAGVGLLLSQAAHNKTEVPTSLLEAVTKDMFEVFAKRERYMIEHFFPKEIEQSERLKVVGRFGIFHTGIATALLRQAQKQKREDITIGVNACKKPVSALMYDDYLQKLELDKEGLIGLFTETVEGDN